MPKPFGKAIAEAAKYEDHGIPDGSAEYSGDDDGPSVPPGLKPKASRADALKLFEELSATLPIEQARQRVKEKTGLNISSTKPYAFPDKPDGYYDYWKGIIQFILMDMYLDYMPKALAAKFSTPDRPITAKMISSPIRGRYAMAELKRMVRESGKDIPLRQPVSPRSVQKEVIASNDAAKPAEAVTLNIKIVGGRAYLNGHPYKIETNAAGNRYVRIKGVGRIPLDVALAVPTKR